MFPFCFLVFIMFPFVRLLHSQHGGIFPVEDVDRDPGHDAADADIVSDHSVHVGFQRAVLLVVLVVLAPRRRVVFARAGAQHGRVTG